MRSHKGKFAIAGRVRYPSNIGTRPPPVNASNYSVPLLPYSEREFKYQPES